MFPRFSKRFVHIQKKPKRHYTEHGSKIGLGIAVKMWRIKCYHIENYIIGHRFISKTSKQRFY